MTIKFLHTADWQMGRPYASVKKQEKRSLLQFARLTAVQRTTQLAREHEAQFVLVAGDLFDSTTPSNETVGPTCMAIGQMGVPVIVIPGNHDHGGPGSIWSQPFFRREREKSAPNLQVLLKPEPLELPGAVIFPCPLLRRAESLDPTTWVRMWDGWDELPAGKPRILLAHGSTQDFSGVAVGSDDSAGNLIDLKRLPMGQIDYVALGDWHGARPVAPNAWYSGTPELDRFPKGGEHDPGQVLLVQAGRGVAPHVEKLPTSEVQWVEREFQLNGENSLPIFEAELHDILDGKSNKHVLRLKLSGTLGLEGQTELEDILRSLGASVLSLRVENQVRLAPTSEELAALTERHLDPLLAQVATRLTEQAAGEGEEALTASVALRQLYIAQKEVN